METEHTATGNGEESPTGFDAVAALGDLFSSQEGKEEKDEAKPKAKASLPEHEGVDAEAEADSDSAEQTELEEEDGAEAESEDEGESEESEDDEANVFTVRVDGKDTKVKLDELLNGYSRTSDYTRKTMDLATERKTFELDQGTVRQERAEYGALLGKLRELVAGGEKEPNWAEIRQRDPVAFAVQREDWRVRQEKLASIDSERQRLEKVKGAEDAQALTRHLATERIKVFNAIPEWKDKKVADGDRAKILKLMESVGYKGDELKVYDARAISVLRKAALYDSLMEQKPDLERKIRVAKPSRPGMPQKPTSNAQRAMNRLKSNGSVANAAALFENLL